MTCIYVDLSESCNKNLKHEDERTNWQIYLTAIVYVDFRVGNSLTRGQYDQEQRHENFGQTLADFAENVCRQKTFSVHAVLVEVDSFQEKRTN